MEQTRYPKKTYWPDLKKKGYGREQLNDVRELINAEKSDLFDVLAYIAFAFDPVTREERVNQA